MTKIEFLDTVTAQMRCKRMRPMISEELEQHILDQAGDYEREGIEAEAAMEKAVEEMGDPVEIGVELDRIHRPRMSWGIVILTALIALAGFGLWMIILANALVQGGEQAGVLISRELPALQDQAFFNLIGFPLMLIVCFVDYSFLGKHTKQIAAAFLIFMYTASWFWGAGLYGGYRFLSFFNIQISTVALMWLYLPLYGALLYAYRGGGWLAIGKLCLWALAGIFYLWEMAASGSAAFALGLALAVLLSLAITKDWYRIKKKHVLGTFWGIMLGVPILLFLLFRFGVLGAESLSAHPDFSYRVARLQAFVAQYQERNNYQYQMTYNYQVGIARTILNNSELIGNDAENLSFTVESLPAFNTDFSFVSLIAGYGILGGVLVIILLLFLICKILHISLSQKNQLGMVVGCAAAISLLVQSLMCILINLGLLPNTSATLPFISTGGTNLIVSYILIGIALSVCRYQNILKEKSLKAQESEKEAGKIFQIKLGGGVLTYERK
ncbi:MAG: FtsW/RodA/SpoVE family cell cycle protein [Acetatifactor sp.]|nr:FtsW/RodA/SpoVE family cell cycle protein [Acetatifactor sp.]